MLVAVAELSWSPEGRAASNSMDSAVGPNNSLKSSLAHTIQCTGLSGVERMVQIGYTLAVAVYSAACGESGSEWSNYGHAFISEIRVVDDV